MLDAAENFVHSQHFKCVEEMAASEWFFWLSLLLPNCQKETEHFLFIDCKT